MDFYDNNKNDDDKDDKNNDNNTVLIHSGRRQLVRSTFYIGRVPYVT
jgi:hypothetical protein